MFIELPVDTGSWQDVIVRIGSDCLPVALRVLDGEPRVIVEWPRSGPGSYRLDVSASGGVTTHAFTIEPSKISSEDFRQLVTALEVDLPASIAMALKRVGGLVGVEVVPPRPDVLAEELARIKRVLYGDASTPPLAKLLTDISQAPHVTFRTTEPWVKREVARRPAAARLARAYARAGNLDREGVPVSLMDSRVHQTFDTYENRILATFVRQLDARLRRLERIDGVGDQAATLRVDFVKALRAAPFLDQVSILRSAPTQITMVLLRRPDYRTAFAAYLAFQRGLAVRMQDPALSTPLNDFPHLYQVWGTLRVILALLEAAASLGYRLELERLIGRDGSGPFVRVLPLGKVALRLTHPDSGREVRLIPEPTYRGGGEGSSPIYSTSFDQRPDVAVEVTSPDGEREIYLFDPKYKLAEMSTGAVIPTKTDIDKMHAYRDAIRSAEGDRAVRYAGILYPGPTVDYGHGIAALQSVPSSAAGLHAKLLGILTAALSPS